MTKRGLTTEGTENTEKKEFRLKVSGFRIDIPTVIITVLWIVFFLILLFAGEGENEGTHADQIPTMTFSALAVWFAYQAYRYTKEKFRLELFEKRWEVYEGISYILKVVVHNNSFHDVFSADAIESTKIIQKNIDTLENNVWGLGYNKGRYLFAEDLYGFFDEIREICLVVYADGRSQDEGSDVAKCVIKANELMKVLPEYFSPYFYFGDYKYESEEKISVSSVLSVVKKFKNMLGSKTRKDETNVGTC